MDWECQKKLSVDGFKTHLSLMKVLYFLEPEFQNP